MAATLCACGALGLSGSPTASIDNSTGSTGATNPNEPSPTNTTGGGTMENPNKPGNPNNPNNPNTPLPVFNCDNANFPVCDGFELVAVGAPPDANRWKTNIPAGNTMAVSRDRAHNGNQSLLIHTIAGGQHVSVQDTNSAAFPAPFLPAPNNHFFVRYWYFDNGAAGDLTQVPDGSSHFYMVDASGPLNGTQQYEKFGGGDGPAGPAKLSWNYFGPDAILGDPNTVWPMAKWTCFEVEFNGQTGELNVWMNDVALPGVHQNAGVWQAPAFNTLLVGWEMDHPPAAFKGTDVYLDDVAYAYRRIGCNP